MQNIPGTTALMGQAGKAGTLPVGTITGAQARNVEPAGPAEVEN